MFATRLGRRLPSFDAAALPTAMVWLNKPKGTHLKCMDDHSTPLSPARRLSRKTSDPSSPGQVPEKMKDKHGFYKKVDCPCCQQSLVNCFCPPVARRFTDLPNAYFKDSFGQQIFWPRLFKEDGGLRFGCAVCMEFNSGLSFASQNVISRGKMEVKGNKLSKATIDGHMTRGEHGDHGRCIANFKLCFPNVKVEDNGSIPNVKVEVALPTRAAQRALQEPTPQLLNHFVWLYAAIAMPVSEHKFGTMINVAHETGVLALLCVRARTCHDMFLGDRVCV